MKDIHHLLQTFIQRAVLGTEDSSKTGGIFPRLLEWWVHSDFFEVTRGQRQPVGARLTDQHRRLIMVEAEVIEFMHESF